MSEVLNGTFGALFGALSDLWSHAWWLIVLLVSFWLYRNFKNLYKKVSKEAKIDWRLLELHIPREILKTPKAMEQVFSVIHAIEGRVSLEVVGGAGESHFYIRTPMDFRNLIESAIYAQYPEAEIYEVPKEKDYLSEAPASLPNAISDVYGVELILKQSSAYPIRTYPTFEESVEERRIDPIANLVEAMSKLKEDEKMWVQIIIEPAKDNWKKEGDELIEKLMGKKKEAPKTPLFGLTFREVVRAPFEAPSSEPAKKSDEKSPNLSSGQKNIIEAIEEKIAKIGFKTTIRFIYIDSRNSFTRSNIVAMLGAFRQFNTQNMNAFDQDTTTVTSGTKGFFKDAHLEARKKNIYRNYRTMKFKEKPFILNTEELATIYHFPTLGVRAPFLKRIESKKSGPPASLPIIE